MRGDISFETYLLADYSYVHSECYRESGSNDEFYCPNSSLWNSDFHNESGGTDYTLAILFPIEPIIIFNITGCYRFTKSTEVGFSIYKRWGNIFDYAQLNGYGVSLSISQRIIALKRKPDSSNISNDK